MTVPGTNFKTYMEIARDRGMATGNVSTAEITDATPAGPSSHISQRGCQGPNDTRTACPTETKAAGGLGSIAEQQADEKFDVVLGGGRARYAQPLEAGGTKNVIDYAKEKGYKYVATEDELNAVTSLGSGERLLGLFHDSNMTTEFNPLIASDTGAGSPTTKCTPANRGTEPSLKEMTDKAITLLQGNQKGFVLQVEGASIDKRDHSADACGQIGELLGMDDADRRRPGVPAHPPGHADPRHRRSLAHEPDHPGQPGPARRLHDAADGRRRADPHRLRHRSGRRQPGPHGLHGPGLRLRPARRRHRRHDRPDRAVPDPHQHADVAEQRLRAGHRRQRRGRQRPRHAVPDHGPGGDVRPFRPGR